MNLHPFALQLPAHQGRSASRGGERLTAPQRALCLTLRSTRTQPARAAFLSRGPSFSSSFNARLQVGPVSFQRQASTMILAISILAACITAFGLYRFFFSGFNDFFETTFFSFLGARDMRAFIIIAVPLIIGGLIYISLQRTFGTSVVQSPPKVSLE